jgi:cellobiose-specific phosphotransferase system component IIA
MKGLSMTAVQQQLLALHRVAAATETLRKAHLAQERVPSDENAEALMGATLQLEGAQAELKSTTGPVNADVER